MDKLDVIYRALVDYKKSVLDCREYEKEKLHIALADREKSFITAERMICSVERDWIEAIEEGLPHIEKAVDEARQFIRSQGEVVPIEKVKRVSRDSVEHLAKHSDLITKEHDGEDLVPDKLYMVERLADFTVYENKFLYMLLQYLKSFIEYRYEKLLKLSSQVKTNVKINKTVNLNNRKTVLKLNLSDEIFSDTRISQDNPIKDILEQIDMLSKSVLHLLQTPLMQEVAKVPMLKPPVTKTNVLKMNRNFKGAAALYDFVTSYDKDGFSVEKKEKILKPLPNDAASEFSDVTMLISFLTYKYGLNINGQLKSEFEKEQQRLKEEDAKKLQLQIAKLKRQIEQNGCEPYEYMLLVEKRSKLLENENKQIPSLIESNQSRAEQIETQRAEIEDLGIRLEESNREMTALISQHNEELVRINDENEREKAELIESHQSLVSELSSMHEQAVARLEAEFGEKLAEAETEIAEAKKSLEDTCQKHTEQLRTVNNLHEGMINAMQEQIDAKDRDCDNLIKAKALTDSRLNALRREHNLISENENFTSKDAFLDLERQYEAFTQFFKEEWKKTKKQIRQDILSKKKDTQSGNKE